MRILIILLIAFSIIVVGLVLFIRRLLINIRSQNNEIMLLHQIVERIGKNGS